MSPQDCAAVSNTLNAAGNPRRISSQDFRVSQGMSDVWQEMLEVEGVEQQASHIDRSTERGSFTYSKKDGLVLIAAKSFPMQLQKFKV